MSSKSPEKWDVEEVKKWMMSLSFAEEYSAIFSENDIDGALLRELDEEILREELNIKNKLHRKKLLIEIEKLFNRDGSDAMSASEEEPEKKNKEKRKGLPYLAKVKRKMPKKQSSSESEFKESEPEKKSKKSSKKKSKKATPTTKEKRVLRKGEKLCPECDTSLKKDIVMCGKCDYVFPESTATRFKATNYFKSFAKNPNYNDRKKLFSKEI
ncbi:hypothetical protein MHBO_000264 [Bonamia ostreae]|uniref:SAM domain-containing protein n=1 Tax=Bonamia ostreae TaxID=126728 RepID=A0ABV2AEZ8_9EUKA